MSTIGDVFSGLRQVLVMQTEIERLRADVTRAGDDLKMVARGLHALDGRVSRLEGFIEGATAARRDPPQLPPS